MKFVKIYIIILAIILLNQCSEKEMATPLRNQPTVNFAGVINDEINGVPVVIYGNETANFFSAFKRVDEDGKQYQFEKSEFSFPDVLKDSRGETWNAFGKHIKREPGKNLLRIDNLIGYWFVFPSFHERIILIDGTEILNLDFKDKDPSDGWRVDKNFVFSGSIKDGIKSIDNPLFMKASGKEFIDNEFYKSLKSDELLTVVQIGNEAHVYPHRILEYHEVVNDIINEQEVAVSFCPLTGTSKAWNRKFDGNVHEFGVSGLLYNNNLILYDRGTGSNWAQIMNQSVHGPLIGKDISSINVWEVKVEDLLNISGAINVLSTETGIKYDYQYPLYGAYKYSDRINFPLSFSDTRIPPKERVIGVTVGDITKVYRFSDFNSEN